MELQPIAFVFDDMRRARHNRDRRDRSVARDGARRGSGVTVGGIRERAGRSEARAAVGGVGEDPRMRERRRQHERGHGGEDGRPDLHRLSPLLSADRTARSVEQGDAAGVKHSAPPRQSGVKPTAPAA